MYSPIERKLSNGVLPIKFFLTSELLPDAETMAQLDYLASAAGLNHHVAVLPDIHRKSRNLTPTGTVVAAKNMLVPRAVDTGINCGISMIRTEINLREFSPAALDNFFGELMRTVPVHEHEHDILSETDVKDILVHGGAWCQKRFGFSETELEAFENRATMSANAESSEAIGSIPQRAIARGQRCFGTLGDGNHFLELQEIAEVLDTDIANRLGLFKGQAFFMLHTGSRGLGSKTMKTLLKKMDEQLPPTSGLNSIPHLRSIPVDSEEGSKFTHALCGVANFGFANRMAIIEKLRAAIRAALHDQSLSLPVLYDCAHVSIKSEQWNGERLWVHRHGASRALPPSQFADHPIFSRTGQPVPIPGSMGNDSFVGVAGERTVETFYSVNHGAGRVMDKPQAVECFTEFQVESEMRAKNIRLYRYGSDNIAEQAPSAFKDISRVIQAMKALSLARPVVRLRPVAVLKG